MNYLVDKITRQIISEAWFDEDKGAWLSQGAVCWVPCILCKDGEESNSGYEVAEIADEKIDSLLSDEEDLYYIEGKVLPRNQVKVSFSAIVSHPDFPDERQMLLTLSNIQIAAYQTFVNEERKKFEAVNPDDMGNKELWHNWLGDAFAEADFHANIGGVNPVPAHVDYIDIENPKVECL